MAKNTKDKTKGKSSKDKTEDKQIKVEEDKGGLSIEELKPEVSGALVRPNLRMWLTADGKKLVPEGHQDAASLYCNSHNSVPKDEFEKLKKVGFGK